ncbi:MAG TPA: cereblon family protein [Polyangia bacterium]|nr:cereblon family protein [Polyangia bacterium]
MLCFQQQPADRERLPMGAPMELVDAGTGPVLACARCRQHITSTSARIAVGGHHEHTRENPHGFQFHIGCFARALGCVAVSEPSLEWTWFPGYAWQIELCTGCAEHLGWRFASSDHHFHGLILDRLVELAELTDAAS